MLKLTVYIGIEHIVYLLRSVYMYHIRYFPLLLFSIVLMLTVWIMDGMDDGPILSVIHTFANAKQ